jgi:hypothetical protein
MAEEIQERDWDKEYRPSRSQEQLDREYELEKLRHKRRIEILDHVWYRLTHFLEDIRKQWR